MSARAMTDYISREAAKKKHCEVCMEEHICYRSKPTCDELKAFDLIPAADVVSGSDFRDCRNELCLRCGNYKQAHNGACDGCRWRANND